MVSFFSISLSAWGIKALVCCVGGLFVLGLFFFSKHIILTFGHSLARDQGFHVACGEGGKWMWRHSAFEGSSSLILGSSGVLCASVQNGLAGVGV